MVTWDDFGLEVAAARRVRDPGAALDREFLERTPDCVKIIGLDGTLGYINAAGRRALAIGDGPLGGAWVSYLPADVAELAAAALASARAGATVRFAGRSVDGDGTVRFWDNLLHPILDEHGRPADIVCVSRDQTGARLVEERRQANEERLATALRVGGMGVWDYDIVHDRLWCDEQWYRIMGRDVTTVRAMGDLNPLIHPEDRDRATEVLDTAHRLIEEGSDYSIDFRIIRPDGEIRWVRSTAKISSDVGTPVRAVGFILDITDAHHGESALMDANRALEAERRELARQSREDPLTGLANRRALDDRLAGACAQVARGGEALSLAMLDVDHFKDYNDRYGHVAGDQALRQVAAALDEAVRFDDLVVRYGGEEFVALLPRTRDPAPVLERMLAAVRQVGIDHEVAPTRRLSVSAGCIVVPGGSEVTAEQLLKLSDRALYEAKSAGRNRSVVHVLGSDLV